MKLSYKLFACAALLSALVGCREKMDYKTTAFVNLNSKTLTIDENAGTVKIPVTLSTYKNNGSTSVTFKVVDGLAQEGKNYSVEPASKVLNFDESGEPQYITVSVVDQPNLYTGNLDFKIALESATNDYQLGGTNATTVNIKDLDHPLVDFAGEWTVQCNTALKGKVKYKMNLTLDDDDVTIVWCDYIVPMLYAYSNMGSGYVKGVVSEDKSTITFASQQLDPRGGETFDVGYGGFTLYTGFYEYVDGENDKYATSKDPIVFTKDEGDGFVFRSKQGPAIVDKYIWPQYYGFVLGEDNDEEVVWTKN